MTQKRNSRSSVVSVMEDENLDLLDFDSEKDVDDDSVDYIETDLGTDNIEDIIVSSKLNGIKSDDFYMMDSSDSSALILNILSPPEDIPLAISSAIESINTPCCLISLIILIFTFDNPRTYAGTVFINDVDIDS